MSNNLPLKNKILNKLDEFRFGSLAMPKTIIVGHDEESHSTNYSSSSKEEIPETPPRLMPPDEESSNESVKKTVTKRYNRVMMMDSDEDSPPPPKTFESCLSNEEKKLRSCTLKFPETDIMVVQDLLRRNDWDEDRVIEILNNKKVEKSAVSLNDHLQKYKRKKDHNLSDEEENNRPQKKKARREEYAMSDDENDYQQDSDNDDDDSDEGSLMTAYNQNMRNSMLKFLQSATLDELQCISGCSRKKAEIIFENRPYDSWYKLVNKLSTLKNFSSDFYGNLRNLVHTRQVVVKLMNHCQTISERIGTKVSELPDNQHILQQPSNLSPTQKLAPYQMLGLNWLSLLHDQNINGGILADEMGLGKTVQAIAFLAYLKSQKINKPHLIIVPSSTLDNWLRELNVWYPSANILCYYGSPEERKEIRFQIYSKEVEDFDIMVSTYNQISSMAEDRNFLKKFEFYYVIFDEGHMLKNMKSNRYQNMIRIKAHYRLLLTGTPLQNNLVELMSLLIFIMPKLFSPKVEQIKLMFSSVKTKDSDSNYKHKRIEHAKHILNPFILRRLKDEVLKQLPKKKEFVEYISMTPAQKEHYTTIVTHLTQEYNSHSDSNHAGGLMQLRKAANHALLFRKHFNNDILRKMSKLMLKEPTHTLSDPELIYEDMEVMSDFELHKLCTNYESIGSFKLSQDLILDTGKFKQLDTLLPKFKDDNNKVLIFSQFTMVLDILEEYCKIRDHKFIRLDGSTKVSERQNLMDDYTNDSEIFIFLLSTKAGGLGINLSAANVVIIHDIDFNPYNDKQAEDRAHRLGQTRDVLVYRFISQETIEEGMYMCAEEKLKLEKNITNIDEETEDGNGKPSANVMKLLKNALRIS